MMIDQKQTITTTKNTQVSDLLPVATTNENLQQLAQIEVPDPIKDPVPKEEITHRKFDGGTFWHKIPAFGKTDEEEFLDWKFQNKNTVRTVDQLEEAVRDLVDSDFLDDVREGMRLAPMNVRLSPYVISRIDWSSPYEDPLRRQFIPVASTRLPDHPRLTLDSLHERKDSPVRGLVHRYPDKALFLPIDVCPVYCRFCTRSYAIGGDTDKVNKHEYKPDVKRWNRALAYVASRPEIEDIVVSGGDAYMLTPKHIRYFGETLLAIPHVRRIRFATKGLAVMPMKVLTHDEWTDTMVDLTERGRDLHKEVCIHTHFNTINEMSAITKKALDRLFERGVKVRNQAVMIRGVNDSPEHMVEFNRKLSFINVQPYYVYQHDMVKGVEELRTTVGQTTEIERHSRGATAGFNTPTYVNDVPGGGGKRDVHSFDHYDPVTGVSVYRSPNVDERAAYLYFDPIDQLPIEGQRIWASTEPDTIVKDALGAAGLEDHEPIS